MREKSLEGQAAARERGRHGGRPEVFDDDMIAYARDLRARGVPVPGIAAKLIIPTGKNKGSNPSVASVYRILADTDASKLERDDHQTRPQQPRRAEETTRSRSQHGHRTPATSPSTALNTAIHASSSRCAAASTPPPEPQRKDARPSTTPPTPPSPSAFADPTRPTASTNSARPSPNSSPHTAGPPETNPADLRYSAYREVSLKYDHDPALLVTACGGAPTPQPGFTLSASTPPAAAGLASFAWSLYAEPPTLDYLHAFDYPQNTILANVCESLMRWTPQLGLEPRTGRRGTATRPGHVRLPHPARGELPRRRPGERRRRRGQPAPPPGPPPWAPTGPNPSTGSPPSPRAAPWR